ncbi:MAG: hypothetical protein WDA42_05520 [Candidatus Bathyarchaeia archaeon]
MDPSGTPHIGYQDASNNNLVYVVRSGYKWNHKIVEPTENYGAYPCLGLDIYDQLHISYNDQDGARLKYANGFTNLLSDGLLQETPDPTTSIIDSNFIRNNLIITGVFVLYLWY